VVWPSHATSDDGSESLPIRVERLVDVCLLGEWILPLDACAHRIPRDDDRGATGRER
jgi:hypothetical protein